MSDELDIRIDNDLAQNDTGNILGSKTIEDVIKKEAKEEQEPSSRFSISRTLGGVIIARFAQRQMKLMLLICALLILHISCRYMCQKKLVELDRLEARIVEAHNKAIVCSSILTEKSRESNVLKRLYETGDSTLKTSSQPPYLIKVNSEEL
ncbi:MAG: hypothetical protein IKO58_04320 [Prevotella sp.]|jgi:hypothetical protein|nr:hypothetical protein [Prevotella sp.]MBR4522354.1 hypothetical protein [Prevotella sp.]